ncbi:hypothetical protein SK571_05025 [Lentzea sp. BCCO 10_0798]|uniref:Uncharacterized protein n=1 Tax=Lentzea kristufekii TaxID=3095430 RepID=A0ABU4TLD5_9PSEU|nr:DUF6886 family protein [Lentzea sp. BCCO 10_0798]MDX8048732.1 hypothetical protein [Lentzea sp. BCCO 10_0798]
MRPEPGQVLHFSEDPSITRFVPHRAATARQPGEYVWAVDAGRSPDYWFPRQCPRAMAWTSTTRVHAIEYGWLERMRTVELYAYRFDIRRFQPFEDHAHVATEPVVPLGPAERVGDLFALHEEAGIELRVLANLWPFWDAVTASTLEFSGIRLRNALPRSVE